MGTAAAVAASPVKLVPVVGEVPGFATREGAGDLEGAAAVAVANEVDVDEPEWTQAVDIPRLGAVSEPEMAALPDKRQISRRKLGRAANNVLKCSGGTLSAACRQIPRLICSLSYPEPV
jgi:hypothetical protein